MRILIIEDEQLAVEKLRGTISALNMPLEVAGVTKSIAASVQWLQQHATPDLILMDIELSDGQSFEIFKQHPVKCPVIFTTSYDEYALKAFQVNSVDYLLKPVKRDDLKRSLAKLEQLQHFYGGRGMPPIDVAALLRELQAQHRPKEYRQRFLVKLGQRLVAVETEDIAFFYTDEKTTFFKTKNNMKYIVDYPIDELETFMDPQRYFRVNRQFLVSIHAIDAIHAFFNGRLKLGLRPDIDKEVVVSRERVNDFKQWMGK